MKKLIFLLLLLSPCSFAALRCTNGFTGLDDILYNSIGGDRYSGSINITMNYNSTAAGLTVRGLSQTYQVVNGVLQKCFAPGWYTIQQTATGNQQPLRTYWGIPLSGTYKLTDTPTAIVNVASDGITVTWVSGVIDFSIVAVGDNVVIGTQTSAVKTITSNQGIVLATAITPSQINAVYSDGPVEKRIPPAPVAGGPIGPPGPQGIQGPQGPANLSWVGMTNSQWTSMTN